jgi:hemerythrin-like domain-containing protein
MNGNELMAAMQTVEQDHQLVLEQMQGLKDAVGHLAKPVASARRAVDHLDQFYKFFATQFAAHMAEEEETLFTLLKKYRKDGSELVASLVQGHDEIRSRLDNLERCLRVASELEDHIPRQVLHDLFTLGWELWHVLDDHARQETAAINECMMQSFLPGISAPHQK